MEIKIPNTKLYSPTVSLVGDNENQVRIEYMLSFTDADFSDHYEVDPSADQDAAADNLDEWIENFSEKLKAHFSEKFEKALPDNVDLEGSDVQVSLYGEPALMRGDATFTVWVNLPTLSLLNEINLINEDLKT